MSEYQFVDFLAIDAPVSEKNLLYMEKQSSRAEITPWRFTNEYNFGDFRGNVEEMLRRGYDVHLHFANFGIRKLMFRLPAGLPCDKRTFKKFAIPHCLTWRQDKRGSAGILTVEPEADAGTYDEYIEDMDSLLERLAPLREMLVAGDLRPLFIFWLACAYDDDEKVRPIPAGLNEAHDALDALGEFYEIPAALVKAAAAHSPPAPKVADKEELIQTWLNKQTKADLQQIVNDLLDGDPATVRTKLLAEIRSGQEQAAWPTKNAGVTLGQLRTEAGMVEE